MSQVTYGIGKNLGQINFEDALEKVAAALKTQGFGVLTEIDVKKTLKTKLDVDFRNYRILGACNPPLAHHALQNELMIGLLLPCNVVVYETDKGEVEVSVVNPREMFKVVENQELAGLADQVETKLRAALDEM